MPEETATTIRIPVPGEEGKHTGHRVRTIVVSKEQGISALYCGTCKKIITYIFKKKNGWTMQSAQRWVRDHAKQYLDLHEVTVDQTPDFIKIIAVQENGVTSELVPDGVWHICNESSSEKSLDNDEAEGILTENGDETGGSKEEGQVDRTQVNEEAQAGIVPAEEPQSPEVTPEEKARGQGQGVGGPRQGDGGASVCVCPKCGAETPHEKGKPCSQVKCPKCGAAMQGKVEKSLDGNDAQDVGGEELAIVKVDKLKQIAYGVFLVPEKADHHGDVISTEDVEKVAHGFLVDYRLVDEMHRDLIRADIVESGLAWKDNLDFYGKKLKKGTWFGAIKIKDKEVWEKVLSGEYKGFSVRIAGVREPIKS